MAKKAPNPIDKHVGSRVRMRRMMLSMSQEKLGDALGLTFQQVQKYEKGTNRIGASRLQQISNILQVPVSFFFEGAPNMPGHSGGMSEAPSPAYVSDFLATSDGLVADQIVHAHQEQQIAPPHRRSRRADRRRRRLKQPALSLTGARHFASNSKIVLTFCLNTIFSRARAPTASHATRGGCPPRPAS